MRVGWKVYRLTKIFSWNVAKWGFFFNTVHLAVHTHLPSVLQCFDLIYKKKSSTANMKFTIYQPTLIVYSFWEEKKEKEKRIYYLFVSIFEMKLDNFLSFNVFRQLSSSLLLYSQLFSQCILWPPSSVLCQTLEPKWNFEPNPFFNPLLSSRTHGKKDIGDWFKSFWMKSSGGCRFNPDYR